MTNDWVVQSKAVVVYMLPEQNQYSPGSGRRPPELVGRAAELEAFDTLRARVRNGRTDRGIVLTGLRGVGKAVLLNEMHRLADSFDWLTVRLEARRDEAAPKRSAACSLANSLRPHASSRAPASPERCEMRSEGSTATTQPTRSVTS